MRSIILKKGREKSLKQRHPWIFSGAIASGLQGARGDLAKIFDRDKNLLGVGYFNDKSSIAGRVLTFEDRDPKEAVAENLHRALEFRKDLFQEETTGYRLVNGEGDSLPGLILDRYDRVVVMQISTMGMERYKELIATLLKRTLPIDSLYEKSLLPSRAEEGLAPSQGWIFGKSPKQAFFKERGMNFIADFIEGQKTGFFLDQRQMRDVVRHIAANRRVLNCFCYSGAFSIAAMKGYAKSVTSVDSSKRAIALAQEHERLNCFQGHTFVVADVFSFLREDALCYDLIILDPPAFCKKRGDVIQACRGYKDINRVAMQKMPKNSLLLTSSCSHFISDELFQKVLFQAAVEARREVKVIDRHHYAADHPESLYHPEGHYLKSLLLAVL